jgi:hypothetical protein
VYTRETAIARGDGKAGVGMVRILRMMHFCASCAVAFFPSALLTLAPLAALAALSPCLPFFSRTQPGGQSWTPRWLAFDNSYFRAILAPATADASLLRLPTDAALTTDPSFAPHVARYAASQAEFFADYAAAHAKLSELGSAFRPAGGIALDA